MAKLAAQLKSKFFGLVGRITVCGRAGHKGAAGMYNTAGEPKSVSSQIHDYLQHVEVRSRGAAPGASAGSKPRSN
ncbi:hypothetical protein ACQ4PT_053516 [Festuca glaucescens]